MSPEKYINKELYTQTCLMCYIISEILNKNIKINQYKCITRNQACGMTQSISSIGQIFRQTNYKIIITRVIFII